jgi:general secretion pathway protein B
MSSILDALKKSERQRRHGEALIFKQAGPGTMPRLLRPALVVLVGVMLLAATLTAVYVRQKNAPVVATAVPIENQPVVPPAPTAAPAPIEDLAEQAAVESTPKAASVVSAPLAASTAAPAPARAANPDGFGQVPWLSELPEVFRNSLPPLTVNIHVYTPDESQRILYINNRAVTRGEQIEGGVEMEEIVQDGVILRFRGQLFKLPRPK